MSKPRLAVHKFSSCDGCQLAFLNAGDDLLALTELVDIVHFTEAGLHRPDARVDIAFVEGSISTPEEAARIQQVRANSRHLLTIGACATSGGIQALRALAVVDEWARDIYAEPDYIQSLSTSTGIAEHVQVDWELWGCPVSSTQVVAAVRALLSGLSPACEEDKVCMECKRQQAVCVLVARGQPCLGPVTRTGCGALCPRFGRDCYGCYGPAENPNPTAMANCLRGLGLLPDAVVRRFGLIHSGTPAFAPIVHGPRRPS